MIAGSSSRGRASSTGEPSRKSAGMDAAGLNNAPPLGGTADRASMQARSCGYPLESPAARSASDAS